MANGNFVSMTGIRDVSLGGTTGLPWRDAWWFRSRIRVSFRYSDLGGNAECSRVVIASGRTVDRRMETGPWGAIITIRASLPGCLLKQRCSGRPGSARDGKLQPRAVNGNFGVL